MNRELIDLAWSVLPKEFKEEVKKIYSTLLANIKMYQGDNPEQVGTTYPILWERTLGIKNTLCRIFGEYNLTSDADGEDDEILHVSRKKLQYFYEKLRKVGESHAAFALQNLFGSKCLPDESESPKLSKVEKVGKDCNVDSSDDCKAEPKFKVGDIVRFKYCCTTYQIDGFKILDGVMLYQVGEVWAEESDLEPYTEPDTSHETPVCENHSDNTSQKEANMNSNRNLSQNIVNCDKQLDNILKDSFRNERRLNIATQIMSAILSNQMMLNNLAHGETTTEGVVRCVVDATMMYTGALIAECGK